MLILKPTGKIVEQSAGTLGIADRIGLIHRGSHRCAQPFGQGLTHVALLVLAAALNQCFGAKYFYNCLVQCFRAIDHN